jgi:quercetin dioxygenase-like cupin family protein
MSAKASRQYSVLKKTFDTPEETRRIPKGRVDVVNLSGREVIRVTFEPGWSWSECVQPIVGTESCQVAHMGYMLQGRMIIRMDDGTEQEFKAGDVGVISPGHNAWIVGNEEVVFIDFQGAGTYAKPQTKTAERSAKIL